LLRVFLVFQIVENLANALKQQYLLSSAQRVRFRNNNRINLRVFLFKKKVVERDMFLLIAIVIRASFVRTNIVIRAILQKKYNNVFALISLREIIKI